MSRYALGSSIPSAVALKLIADMLGVSTDHLLSDEQAGICDRDLHMKFEAIQEMNGDEQQLIDRFLDMVNRDFKTRKNDAVGKRLFKDSALQTYQNSKTQNAT